MKKLLWVLVFLQVGVLQAIFIGIKDDSSQNRFLGQHVKSCKVSGKNSYDCGNGNITGVLNIDFFDKKNFGKQFYLFNDFIYWINDQAKAQEYDEVALRYTGSKLIDKINKDYPAQGTYMIVLGTSQYLQHIVAPAITCPSGEWMITAQLKYNDGKMIYAWSQDSICLKPHDKFSLEINSDLDTTIPPSSDNAQAAQAVDGQGIDWMKDLGPNSTYQKASGSPRTIRLIKNS